MALVVQYWPIRLLGNQNGQACPLVFSLFLHEGVDWHDRRWETLGMFSTSSRIDIYTYVHYKEKFGAVNA